MDAGGGVALLHRHAGRPLDLICAEGGRGLKCFLWRMSRPGTATRGRVDPRLAGMGWESADKPGFVVGNHSSRISVTADLERPTRTRCGPHLNGSLFGLAPGGVYHRRGVLPPTRCALTAPFHPYRHPKMLGRYTFCCTFRRLAPPRRYLAPCPVEPGLSSPAQTQRRLPGRLSARSI